LPEEATFDKVGSSIFIEDGYSLELILGLLNTQVAVSVFGILNPTLDLQVMNVRDFPIPVGIPEGDVISITTELIQLAKEDWSFVETSPDFSRFPFLLGEWRRHTQAAFQSWGDDCWFRIGRAHDLERKLNALLIPAYGLQLELSSEVPDDQITLARPDGEQDIQRLVSYAIGCMMGRYSLDKPGLVYAHNRNEGLDPRQYLTFPADADGIIPITELAWFSDDATERFVEFISKTWPREHLEENLKFIGDSLGANRDEHPRDTIRRYLGTGFYKDHLSTYKKRPIYWLFSTGKQRAFQCLVYLHRYHEGSLARMRTEYVIPLQGKMSHRIDQLVPDIAAATSTSHRRKLEKERDSLVKQRTELAAFDEKLRHYADQRIALDLDDGVKVNYGKFGDLLAEVKAVTGGTEE
jgi:hypothetical protein